VSERKIAVANAAELKDGEMKEVSADGTPILLTRVGGEYHALGAHCPHYGAPLAEGVLSDGRIICPWHHACFDAKTGQLEEPPALDSLPRFDLTTENEKILVTLPPEIPDRATPKMARRDPADKRLFVILGGGAAGYMAAQTLREDGYAGRIVMVTREDQGPYDRPNLSKDYLSGNAEPEWMPLRSSDFFAENDIEIMSSTEALSVDSAKKTIIFKDDTTFEYDSLLVATGGEPRTLPIQTDNYENVFLLRSFSDSDRIAGAAEKGQRVVVIGASFIGMEAAGSLRTRGCEVTVTAPDEVPFEKILGTEIGKLFQEIHEQNGVKFKLGTHAQSFKGDGRVDAIVLQNGERLEADLVVVGIGVKPATAFLKGVELHRDGGVVTDEHLCAGNGLYAAGDIAHFPDHRTGEMTRIEHWRIALQLGRTAAHNMAGKPTRFTAIPFFWTTQYDATLNYVGHVKDWDSVIIRGDIGQRDFLAFYIKDHRILAVAGMNRDRELAIWEELIRQYRVPPPSHLSDDSADLSLVRAFLPDQFALSTL
jgi:apoptosis-inducing factor 3